MKKTDETLQLFNRRELLQLAAAGGLTLGSSSTQARSHFTAEDSGRDWTIDDLSPEQRVLADRMLAKMAEREAFFLDVIDKYNGSREVETLEYEDEKAAHTVYVSRGEVLEKTSFYTNYSKMAVPPYVPEAIWDRYYEFNFHSRTPLLGQLHATVYFTYMASGKSAIAGYMDYTPGTWIEEDNEYLKKIVDDHFAEYGRDTEKYRMMLNLPYHKDKLKAAGVGAAFYVPPLMEINEENLNFVIEANEKFVNGYLDLLEKRKDQPYTEQDLKNQAAMRKRWLEDHLFEDPLPMYVVPYEVWSFADAPPTVHW